MPAALKVLLVTPAPRGTFRGNRITALRWARLLRQLGMRVRVAADDDSRHADVLLALHAKHSAGAVAKFAERAPDRPIIVGMGGTDLYCDLPHHQETRRTVARADRLVLLQPQARDALPPQARKKARVIYQSVKPLARKPPRQSSFDVCVLAYLRPVKDPLRTALASRKLPARSRIRVLHAGGELTPGWAAKARAEERDNDRYRWLGELRPGQARQLLVRSRLLVLSSVAEGGANVTGEALALGTPMLASRIDGNTGLLGRRYPGLFEVGDTEALSALLLRAEEDEHFYQRLLRSCHERGARFTPELELEAWRKLFAGLRL